MAMRRLAAARIAVCAWLGVHRAVAFADADADDATRLDDIVVVGKRGFLYESDRQLARVTAGLPELGSDAAPRRGAAEAIADAFRQDPDDLRPEDQQMMLRMTEGGDPRLP